MRRQIVSGWAAVNRRDLDLMFVRYSPDVVYEFHTGVEVLGISGTVHGRHAVREAFETIREGLTWVVEPDVMLDLGERFLLLGRLRVSGPESQIELDGSFAQLLTISGGLIAREQDFRSWDEGLTAAGLDRSAIAMSPTG